MKHLKMLGLMALSVTAVLAASVGSASATELTSPKGTVYNGTISAETENGVTFEGGVFEVSCNRSTWEAEIESQGSSVTVSGKFKNLTFTECGQTTVAVVDPGTFKIHTDGGSANGNGTITSTGMTITTLFHVTIFGAPWTLHCITETNESILGTIIGSTNTGATARTETLRVEDPTDAACSEQVAWTSSYRITEPDYLDVD